MDKLFLCPDTTTQTKSLLFNIRIPHMPINTADLYIQCSKETLSLRFLKITFVFNICNDFGPGTTCNSIRQILCLCHGYILCSRVGRDCCPCLLKAWNVYQIYQIEPLLYFHPSRVIKLNLIRKCMHSDTDNFTVMLKMCLTKEE